MLHISSVHVGILHAAEKMFVIIYTEELEKPSHSKLSHSDCYFTIDLMPFEVHRAFGVLKY